MTKLARMKKEELELYSYTDLAKMIIKEEKKPLNTPTIFKKICDLLEMSDDEYTNKIGDFYTSMTTDKSFILLESGDWDLSDNHPKEVDLEDEDIEEDYEEIDEDNEPIEDDLSDGDTEDEMTEIDDDTDDELTILTEEELEED
ncbi:MAG: DNA-directed RNA polymerase subunit delta [Bacilli bacterium]|nr:DNA-directed RNA polymerase subunit delta [Bacilli bacterium]